MSDRWGPFELSHGERPVGKIAATLVNTDPGVHIPFDGSLYLTTHRLGWKRSLLNLPPASPAKLAIALHDVRDCTVSSRWGLHGLRVHTHERDWAFIVRGMPLVLSYILHGRTTRAWQKKILNAAAQLAAEEPD